MRSLAIILVLILHQAELTPTMPLFLQKMASTGWSGVDLFFVLSGFLIGGQAFTETLVSFKTSLRNFWVKRWFRTFPLYFVVLFVYVIVKPIVFHKPFNDDWRLYLFYLQNFFSPHDFLQSWSLCIEEQFYFIFPLLVFGFSFLRKKTWVWVLPLILTIASRFWIVQSHDISYEPAWSYLIRFPTHTHLDGLP